MDAPEYDRYLELLRLDISIQNLSPSTMNMYTRAVRNFLQFCEKSPEELGEKDIKKFITHMKDSGISPRSICAYVAGIKFFFESTMEHPLNHRLIPRMKITRGLPTILSKSEVADLLHCCTNLKHKTIFTLAYGSGLRVSEICDLRVGDIDSQNMVIHVRCGKGGKARLALLPTNTLQLLRKYWVKYSLPRDPQAYLFPGVGKSGKYTPKSANNALAKWAEVAGIKKEVTMHSLRHSFATHLMDSGLDIFKVKELLGHTSIKSTTVYLHTSPAILKTKSPIDSITL